MNWTPLIISICGSFVSILVFGTIAWIGQSWVKGVNEKLEKIMGMVVEMKVEKAEEAGSNNMRFAQVETNVKEHAERIARAEGSSKRAHVRIDELSGFKKA